MTLKSIKHTSSIVIFSACTLAISTSLSAQLLNFDFTGTSPSENIPWTTTASIDPLLNLDTGFGYTPITNGFGSASHHFDFTNVSPDDVFAISIWNQHTLDGDASTRGTLADAIQANHFVSFSVSPQEGYELDLNGSTLSFDYRLNNLNQARSVSVFSSVGGFEEGNELQTFTSQTTSFQNLSVTFSGSEFDDITESLEFRLYLHDSQFASNNGTRFSAIDNLVLDGSISAIPEPSQTVAVMIASIFGLVYLTRCRR